MNYRFTTYLLAAALFFTLGAGITRAAPLDQAEISVKGGGGGLAPLGDYDFTNHGTGWVNETPTQVELTYKAWGAVARAKTTPGEYWVHIPMPFPTYLASSFMNIKYVEFCAKSTNGAVSKPVHMDLWANDGKFLNGLITWPADNAKHCSGHTFFNPIWKQDLGISVKIYFANTTDKVTLYKAWVKVAP